jgi:hypothetical protein
MTQELRSAAGRGVLRRRTGHRKRRLVIKLLERFYRLCRSILFDLNGRFVLIFVDDQARIGPGPTLLPGQRVAA